MRPLTRLAADPLSHLLKGRLSRPGCERGHRTQALPRPVIPWYRHRGKWKGWDFVTGFGFYLSAIYAVHYNMLKHVTKQLSEAIASDGLKISIDWTRQGIFGRGHNALAPYLTSLLGFGDSTRPKQYRSVSGFAPGSNLGVSPWGIKAVTPRWGGWRYGWFVVAGELFGEGKGGWIQLRVRRQRGNENGHFFVRLTPHERASLLTNPFWESVSMKDSDICHGSYPMIVCVFHPLPFTTLSMVALPQPTSIS